MTGTGTQVDDPIRVRHDGLVVLHDNDGFPGVDQTVQHAQEAFDVGQVKTRGGLIQDVGAALLPHARGQLEALAFTS